MPTVLKIRGFRFFFFSMEGNEPAHIHVEKNDCLAKYWLTPAQLASNYGFKSHDLVELGKIVFQHKDLFLEKWHEHFKN